MASLIYLTYLIGPILLVGFIVTSLYLYKYKTNWNLGKYSVKTFSNYNIYNRMSTLKVDKTNSIVKTYSTHNLTLLINTEPGSHYKLSNKLLKLNSNDPDYLFIREIIRNSYNPAKKCSNPRCKKKLDMKGCIYNAFDVQFCCANCRDLSTKHVIKHWI